MKTKKTRRARTFWSVFLLVLLCQTAIFGVTVATKTWGTPAATGNILMAVAALIALTLWGTLFLHRRRRALVDRDADHHTQ